MDYSDEKRDVFVGKDLEVGLETVGLEAMFVEVGIVGRDVVFDRKGWS